tara:strand:- start:293 stop:481 length:189 start_codon:yes stop_codon:yes gene_type:complete
MLYTKGSIVGYSGEDKRKVLKLDFNCIMSDDELAKILDSLREPMHDVGEALHFKLTLESEDI